MVELVAVLRLEKSRAKSLLTRLVIAAAAMIALGYPGEVISSPEGWTMRVVWGALSSIPFFYILFVLWVELTKSLDTQPLPARRLIEIARLVRHALVHNGGRLTPPLKGRKHALMVEADEIQIMAPDTTELFGHLKLAASRLAGRAVERYQIPSVS